VSDETERVDTQVDPIDSRRTLSARAPSDGLLAKGTVIGAYIVDHKLGEGGCGVVYRGTHRGLGSPVAIKVLRPDCAQSPEMLTRFRREAAAAARIGHPNIVQVHDVGELDDGRPYFTMEFLSGINLHQLLARERRLSLPATVELLSPVCLGLQAAHDAGIVHRDVKASNIMLAYSGDSQIVKVVDFGIAKLLASSSAQAGLTAVGRPLGTLCMMPPEQILGKGVDARADVYALGVLTFQLLTGQLPFVATTTQDMVQAHLCETPRRPSDVVPLPIAVDGVVLRALDKHRERRFATVVAFHDALRATVPMAGPGAAQFRDEALEIVIDVRRRAPRHPEGGDADDLDQAILELLEEAEADLEDSTWHIELSTTTALAARRSLHTDGGASPTGEQALLRQCEQLFERLAARAADLQLDMKVRVRGDRPGPPRTLLARKVQVGP
jgi:serine/threonine-protein kinase